jgi:hypothetical protein
VESIINLSTKKTRASRSPAMTKGKVLFPTGNFIRDIKPATETVVIARKSDGHPIIDSLRVLSGAKGSFLKDRTKSNPSMKI